MTRYMLSMILAFGPGAMWWACTPTPVSEDAGCRGYYPIILLVEIPAVSDG